MRRRRRIRSAPASHSVPGPGLVRAGSLTSNTPAAWSTEPRNSETDPIALAELTRAQLIAAASLRITPPQDTLDLDIGAGAGRHHPSAEGSSCCISSDGRERVT
ncbi:tail fiber assembly protein [Pinirhizobacter sp.]|uniref:tail fiber assembly protein n=1 Tax=Pinirhizobacter sp. TaxID=2950432 RepID=UPI0039C930DC